MSQVRIALRSVEKRFESPRGSVTALSAVDLEIRDGEFVCLVGPSGCGKSSLLDLVAGFDEPSAGAVEVDGVAVAGPQRKVVTLFQAYGLFPWRNVLGNVEYGLEVSGVPRRERREVALQCLDLVGLSAFARHHPHELSGGMQQRIALARALAVDPECILMDEPFGALDAITRIKLQEELARIWEQRRKTIVCVTHDIEEAVFLADRILVMASNPGRVKTVLDVRLPRPRSRTSADFDALRRRVYEELELVHELQPDYAI
ncbi:MAG TPA: ABC transporter ATP-binding protein [Anaeromyxobacteraceae bacterium]|nr:ABC transporter ATP-binding protein [Anaeromyxobacteraceae bacterium]